MTAEIPLPRSVVYVEDNAANVALMRRICERASVTLYVTESVGEAVDLVRSSEPSLVLTDLHLKDGSGEELITRLHNELGVGLPPIVVLSADASPEVVARVKAAGAAEYVLKPFKIGEIFELIATHCPSSDSPTSTARGRD